MQFRYISVTLNEPLYHLIDIYNLCYRAFEANINSYISNALGTNDCVSHSSLNYSSLWPKGTNKDAAAAILI